VAYGLPAGSWQQGQHNHPTPIQPLRGVAAG